MDGGCTRQTHSSKLSLRNESDHESSADQIIFILSFNTWSLAFAAGPALNSIKMGVTSVELRNEVAAQMFSFA